MLQDQAMLAELSISQWTARKYDKGVSREVEKAHNASDAGRFNKLLIDKKALDPISSAASAIRQCHYRFTLPWSDDGARLLPSKLFMDYTAEMRKHKATFDTAVGEFTMRYPLLVQDARARLGTMYDPQDYPAAIKDRFGVATRFIPVPDAKDFRVDVGEENLEVIRKEISETVYARQAEAMKDCWARIKEVLGRYVDRLSDPKNVFKDTMVENAKDLVVLLPALNVANDQTLSSIVDEIRERIAGASPAQLRNRRNVRSEVYQAACEILSRVP